MTGLLLAQATTSRTYYEWMRVRQLDEWWHWLLLALVCLILVSAVSTMYFLDSRQLARGKRWLLLLLRVLAFVGLLIFFMDLQKRTEQKLVKNSRFVFLVDTSQSMGIADQDVPAESSKEAGIAQVARVFRDTELLNDIRQRHDVTIYRFDETNLPVELASFSQTKLETVIGGDAAVTTQEEALGEVRVFWKIALGLFALSVVALLMHRILGRLVRTAEGESWALLVCVFALFVGVVLVAVSNLRHPGYGPRVAFGWVEITPDNQSASEKDDGQPEETVAPQPEPSAMDWATLLEPAGGSTRLGDAVNWVLAHERGTPLAGIGVITDGNSNRGMEPLAAAQLASAAEIPIFPVGIASELHPTNVRLVDLVAPARVYPGDEFKLTGYVQAYGLAGQVVDLQLISHPENNSNGEEVLEADLSVELGVDGAVIPLPMTVTPESVGKRIYTWKVTSDQIDIDQSDNQIAVKVQIVDRKSRVLLLAGGPTREYRFVRNMLHRDKDVSIDVLLQTAVDGVAQDADDILFDLPIDPGELFDYDAIVAFDPDWTRFDTAQLELLEQWVAEKAGGLICIAGPVHTSAWAEDRRAPPQIDIVRQLYPVTFSASRIQLGRYGSEIAWPLAITDDGKSTSFLSIAPDEQDAGDVWTQFPGVYGYFPIRDVKPAAAVYARYSDPQVAADGQQPALIVGQFFGAGRVVFMGTGEMWRLRALDEGYFERFYTKLIRFVSEGRLLRDSNRGLLLVDKERALRGDAIAIRASIVDQQFQPLRDPVVKVNLKSPQGTQQLELRQVDDGREGMYAGRFIASQPGDYQVQLVLPGDGEPVVLEREVRVRLPNLEIERPQRNDLAMTQLAKDSGGSYFVGLDAAVAGETSLAATIVSKRRETFLPGTPDREFQRRLMSWLLTMICGALFLEWLIRRMSKLA